MDRIVETCVKSEVLGPVTSVRRGRKYVDFTVQAGGVAHQFRVTKNVAVSSGLKYPVHTLVLYNALNGSVEMVISNPSTTQLLQGVAWTEGGDLPS